MSKTVNRMKGMNGDPTPVPSFASVAGKRPRGLSQHVSHHIKTWLHTVGKQFRSLEMLFKLVQPKANSSYERLRTKSLSTPYLMTHEMRRRQSVETGGTSWQRNAQADSIPGSFDYTTGLCASTHQYLSYGMIIVLLKLSGPKFTI